MWLSGLSARLQTKGLLVQFLVRAYAWAAGQVPSWGCTRGNHTLMFKKKKTALGEKSVLNEDDIVFMGNVVKESALGMALSPKV